MTIKPRHWLALALAFAAPGAIVTPRPAVAQQQASVTFAQPVSPALLALIAPTGKLRVGLYPGSPSSLIPGEGKEGNRGVGFELGRALAGALGVEFEPIVFQSNGLVLAAAREKKIDVIFTNATPARGEFLDFAAPLLMTIDQSYLVTAKSPARSADQIDRAGIRVGVSPGSTSQATLPGILKNAQLVVAKDLKTAAQMLNAGELDAFASNKGILFELSDNVPASTVLDGAWGVEKIAIGLPKGRDEAIALIGQFSQAAKSSGLVTAVAQRAGMRGFRTD